MGSTTESTPEPIAILPLVAMSRGKQIEQIPAGRTEWDEVSRAAIHRLISSSLGMIPGYDWLDCAPPVSMRHLIPWVESSLLRLRDERDRSGGTDWSLPAPLSASEVAAIPEFEAYSPDLSR